MFIFCIVFQNVDLSENSFRYGIILIYFVVSNNVISMLLKALSNINKLVRQLLLLK